jgi:hypothetical protein
VTDKIHVFERSNLGKAPFRFVGVSYKTYQACQGAPVQPGGSCDFCGTGIAECCLIQDVNGKQFIVGNTCVNKTGDAGLISATKRAVNAARSAARQKKQIEKIHALKALLATEAVQARLKAEPHPRGWAGKTLLDYVDWMMQNAGNSGRLSLKHYIDPKKVA